ncbi:glycosyltransferase family 4 protein [bacterium]|nr:glycosyltransferase family 4 protein [bacterium]MCI0606201.1 glycosyltransferase family 4 protein [bacterium]
MRIGIDAHSAERDGTGNCTYIQNLILHLTKLDTNNQYVLFVTDRNHSFYKNLEDRKNVEMVPIRHSPAWLRVFFSLCLATKRKKIDVLHVQYFAPFRHRGVLINTIHDITPFRFPEYFSRFERLLFRILLPSSARRARLILTSSVVSKDDLIRLMQLPKDKIRVGYLGVDQNVFSNHQKADDNGARNRYPLNDKFLLYVGRIDPRKNLTRLIQAYTHLRSNSAIEHKLLIAGKIYFKPERLHEVLEECKYRHDIHFCGYVPEEDLPVLYRAADLFIYTSEYEGFGLPPLEAMASGTPVVASDIPIFREILADAALLVNPVDVHSIVAGIERVLTDFELRKKLTEKAKSHVQKFNWNNTALITLRSYEEAINRPS